MVIAEPDHIVCWTCDVEIDQKEDLELFARIPKLLDYYNIRATFFIHFSAENYHLLENFDLVSHLQQHELGLHIHWGGNSRPRTSYAIGLDSLPISILEKEMDECLNYCRKLGFEPTSFRGGGLCQTTRVLELITKSGFHVDSSVAAKLNEKRGWFQKHVHVPYRSWYFPSKESYDVPASDADDRMGILELPVTRLIPSLRRWSPYTLTPTTPLFKIITNEWLLRSRWEHPLVIVPIFHSWGESLQRLNFDLFLKKLRRSILYLMTKGFVSLKIKEVYDLVA